MLLPDEVTKVSRVEQMGTERFRLTGLGTQREMDQLSSKAAPANPEITQSRRLLVALGLLLGVLVVVVMKNSDFWFGSSEIADDSVSSESIVKSSPVSSAKAQSSAASATPVRHGVVAPSKQSAQEIPASRHEDAIESPEPVEATKRVVLPPLDVEVVAGDKRSTVHPGTNTLVAEINGNSNHASITAPAATFTSNAAMHERLSAAVEPELRQTIETTYPTLGQHSRVQGSVVLEAVIGADGAVEGMRVLSGPAILSGAAQQAVRQWRFKPYLQNGQPVETKCTVTVNFSIRVSDSASKVS